MFEGSKTHLIFEAPTFIAILERKVNQLRNSAIFSFRVSERNFTILHDFALMHEAMSTLTTPTF